MRRSIIVEISLLYHGWFGLSGCGASQKHCCFFLWAGVGLGVKGEPGASVTHLPAASCGRKTRGRSTRRLAVRMPKTNPRGRAWGKVFRAEQGCPTLNFDSQPEWDLGPTPQILQTPNPKYPKETLQRPPPLGIQPCCIQGRPDKLADFVFQLPYWLHQPQWTEELDSGYFCRDLQRGRTRCRGS